MRWLLIPALCLWVPAVAAETGFGASASEKAREALGMLEAAAEALDAAEGGRDRVRALTETVQGYEAGLAALRDGIRTVALREAQLDEDLAAREIEIARLLGVLQSMTHAPAPVRLLHPEGPASAARAGLLLADVTPALQAEVATLRAQLREVQDLQVLQARALTTLEDGLAGAQTARAALSQAVADRVDLPRRFTEDPIQTAVLIAATETLDAFSSSLSMIAENEETVPLPEISERKGALALPVSGRVLRAAGESDAAGVTRPGILVATRPQALVSTPVPATVRYAGPLLNYGLVAILEPQADTLFVFAGMTQIFAETGLVLPQGDPVGLMGPAPNAPDVPASQTSDGGGNTRPETLYIEVRENGRTVDPESWFNTGRE